MENDAVNLRQIDLFAEFDAGLGRERGNGCAKPIGRRTGTRRRVLHARPRRPSPAAVLSEIRSLLRSEFGNVTVSLRRLERGARTQLDIQSVISDQLANMLTRLVKIERHLELVETPQAPRISRRRPLAQ
jgi:hypothetical protein